MADNMFAYRYFNKIGFVVCATQRTWDDVMRFAISIWAPHNLKIPRRVFTIVEWIVRQYHHPVGVLLDIQHLYLGF